ncbi:Phage gp6-like head-tail connector protein [Hathewaya proteolytica DSM 3090]|uniref:Phage gp6-like head-tail connector protein n=1 Tax=Hathewaya proteolytica DSM 3090 TaxID=1121331 RepID=A0A1M6L1C3_9CLOT|nr:phage head-tail connector protein [Hathewaya proteolytica]SHJ64924.1 Phage gp6-like head-tail connector protein [Hathewaya proteolytica DSM 3090]
MLENIKILLNLKDTKQDVLLNLLIDNIKQKILNYTGLITIPTELEYIVMELTIIRYRKLGLEHTTGQSMGGTNITIYTEDIPQEYKEQLDKFTSSASKGKVRFL